MEPYKAIWDIWQLRWELLMEKDKALIIATVSGFAAQFEMNNIHILQSLGYEVHYAANFHNPHYGKDNRRLNGTGIICHQVDFARSPFCIRENGKAYMQLKKLMREHTFGIIHCHTPVGGALGRIAARKYRKNGTKVLYTAHGFHFFQGAPIWNWLLYFPIEWMLARDTDVLITINEEDYNRAKKYLVVKNRRVEKVQGVGIDIEEYQTYQLDKEEKRKELGILSDQYLLISIGELTKRKNHQIVIKALALIKRGCRKKKIKYLICGEGPERKRLERLIKKEGLEDIVLLSGYRTDAKELLKISDCFLFPSRQEGLPVALMEAMAVGIPVVCSRIRGNKDLLSQGKWLVEQSPKAYKKAIIEVMKGEQKGYTALSASCDRKAVEKEYRRIYVQAKKDRELWQRKEKQI